MRVGNFSVTIPQGIEHGTGHVWVKDKQKFTIRLLNGDHYRRCDAIVTLDGKEVGGFRIDHGQTLTLERPSHDTGCFTFYKQGTSEAEVAGSSSIAADLRGVVQVVFKPEKKPIQDGSRGILRGAGGQSQSCMASPDAYKGMESPTSGLLRSVSVEPTARRLSLDDLAQATSGITGLSGKSDQRFITVADLDYDPALETVITLRLVADKLDDGPRPLTAVPKANPVPVAVD